MTEPSLIEIGKPAPFVRRITLNRPDKRIALSNALRAELFAVLEASDRDADARVTVIKQRGIVFFGGL